MANRFLLTIAFVIAFPSYAADPANLYKTGHKAYQDKDYVNALKYLFAYQEVMGEKLASDLEGRKKLEAAIAHAEKELRFPALKYRITKLDDGGSGFFAVMKDEPASGWGALSTKQLKELSVAHKAAAKIIEEKVEQK